VDSNGALSKRFVYTSEGTSPEYLVTYTSGTITGTYRIISDHLGSPRLVINTDPSKADDVLLEARYSAFGIATSVRGSLGAIPFGFAGGLYDADTGLVHFGARDYDPRLGRWTSKDPILLGGGQTNLYVYVGNDPVNRRDPSGLADQEFCSHMASNEAQSCMDKCSSKESNKGTCDKVADFFGAGESFAKCAQNCADQAIEFYGSCRKDYDYNNFLKDKKENEGNWQGGPCLDWDCYASL
jgi:RHS repeat-associated protein